jgi:anti-sigma regulatory factor (Ser/Thr protein kinase)
VSEVDDGLIHEAFVYRDLPEFVTHAAGFVADAVVRDEPVLVAVDDDKAAALAEALPAREGVEFADLGIVGANPARVIALWDDYVGRHGDRGGRVCALSDQRWPMVSPAHLVEHRVSEGLINHAFGTAPLSLLCGYDQGSLPASLLDAAHDTHPRFRAPGTGSASNARYRPLDPAGLWGEPLPPPPPDAATLTVGESLITVRRFVAEQARMAGADERTAADVVLAVSELAANGVVHGGATGTLRVWVDDGWLVCEVTDKGTCTDPLVGRRRPRPGQLGGWGLWMVYQLADLFQFRSRPGATTARVYFRRTATR